MDVLFGAFGVLYVLGAWLVSGWAGAYIMRSKGRSPGAGVAPGLLLNALGLFIALVLSERTTRASNERASTTRPRL